MSGRSSRGSTLAQIITVIAAQAAISCRLLGGWSAFTSTSNQWSTIICIIWITRYISWAVSWCCMVYCVRGGAREALSMTLP